MSRDADGRELTYDDGYALGEEDGRVEGRAEGAKAATERAAGILRKAADTASANTAGLLLRLAKKIEEV